jgi:glycosyltransferase involved in cell wall biosynthesis
MPTNVCVIIPCFNEIERLDFRQLGNLPPGLTCLLVDDGSEDGTGDLIHKHESATLRLLRLGHNVGKAEAIRQGMLHARANGLLEGVAWVGYWDADLATPLSEIEDFIAYAASCGGQVDGILGSRIYKLGSTIVRSYRRHLLGRTFATVSAALLSLHCYDSQCGAKLFRPEVLDRAFGEPFLSRWIFDVEILARLRRSRLIEYPLRRWIDTGGSKISVIKTAVPTMVDLIRIRRRYLTREKVTG